MGGLSVWHWLVSAPILLFLIAIGVLFYFVLRKRPAAVAATLPVSEPVPQAAAEAVVPVVIRTPTQKIVSITYLVGGAFGTIMVLPQLDGLSLGLLSAIAWMVVLAQIAAALYGGWQYWNGKVVGFQVLYWLSWSCVPVISFPVLTYWRAMGLGIFPTISLGAGHIGSDVMLRLGYAGEFWFLPNNAGFVVGANLVAIAFVIMLDRVLKESGVPRWPLAIPQRYPRPA
jgi:hypothetical protein